MSHMRKDWISIGKFMSASHLLITRAILFKYHKDYLQISSTNGTPEMSEEIGSNSTQSSCDF